MELSQKDFVRAACRAIYLWEFGNDELDKEVRVSDAALMKHFGLAWIKYTNGKRQIVYTSQQLRDLILNCQVRKSQLNNPKNSQITAYLLRPTVICKNTQDTYYSVLDRSKKAYSTHTLLRTRWEYGVQFTEELAQSLNARNVGLRGGVQRAYASRVLFFALPQIHVYNYSEPLVEALKANFGLVSSTVDGVFKLMNELYLLHENELKKLPRPNFPSNLKATIRQGDWWERRVLDLAILQNWKCFCKNS
jgi:hypothetical protein